MSEYRKLATKFTSRQHLREALKAAGVPFEEVRPGQPERHLVGYQGDTRPETATFIVRRKHISDVSNDLGFKWDPKQRCFVEIVSEYDQTCRQTVKLRQTIKREYAVAAATSAAKAKGYRVNRIDLPTGEVQLKVAGRI